jgi:uncharacterized cupredoxin-like copper-binding protein
MRLLGAAGSMLVAGTVALVAACAGGGQQPIEVDLTEWTVTPSVAEVRAGEVVFSAHNRSSDMVHELAVLTVDDDGNKRPVAEIEDIAPGESGKTAVTLKPGRYELACLIVPGEAGSTVDHYHQGMHTSLTVR